MATETEARIARDRAFAEYEALFGVRPRAVGIVATADGDHWIKVTFPHQPRRTMGEIGGVRLTYDIAETPVEFVGASEAPWMEAVRRARRKTG